MPGPHKDWTVSGGPEPVSLLVEIVNAHRTYRWLPKPGRAALLSAKGGGEATGHPLTLRSLRLHGLLDVDGVLTEAGRVVAKWNPPPKATVGPDRPATPENGAPAC